MYWHIQSLVLLKENNRPKSDTCEIFFSQKPHFLQNSNIDYLEQMDVNTNSYIG